MRVSANKEDVVTNPTRTRELETRRAGDDVLVHDAGHDKIHVLNATAGQVLELCDGAHTIGDIARSLSESTGADFAVVIRDIELILHEFSSLQLLEK